MIRRRRAEPAAAPFLPSDAILSETHIPFQLVPGHPARALNCYVCDQVAGAEPVRLATLITGFICDYDGCHLMGGTVLRHDRCPQQSVQVAGPKIASLVLPDQHIVAG